MNDNNKLEKEYWSILNDLDTGIYVTDINTYEILYVNRACEYITYAFEKGNWKGKKCYEYFMNSNTPCCFCKIKQMKYDQPLIREFLSPRLHHTLQMKGRLIKFGTRTAHIEYIADITYEKEKERKHTKFVNQLTSMPDNIPIGMCLYSFDGETLNPIVHNQSFYDVFGYSSWDMDNIQSHSNFLDIHLKDLESIKKNINNITDNNSDFKYTYRYFNNKLKQFNWVHMKAKVIFQKDGTKYIYATYTDVTDFITISNQLKIEKGKYESLLKAIPGGVAELDIISKDKINIVYFNDEICSLSGYSREEIYQNGFRYICRVHPDDNERLNKTVMEGMGNSNTVTANYRMITKNGDIRYLHLRVSFIPKLNNIKKCYAVYTDITENKMIEDKLKESEQRYSLAVEGAGLTVWEYDIQSHCILHTDGSNNSYKMNNFINNLPYSLIESGYAYPEEIEKLLEMYKKIESGQPTVSEEFKIKNPANNTARYERVTHRVICDENGVPTKAYGAVQDITNSVEARLRYEEILAMQDASASNAFSASTINLTKNKVIEYRSQGKRVERFSNFTVDEMFAEARKYVKGKTRIEQYDLLYNRCKLIELYQSGIREDSIYAPFDIGNNKEMWLYTPITITQNPLTGDILGFIYSKDVTRKYLWQQVINSVATYDIDMLLGINIITQQFLGYNFGDKEPKIRENYNQVIEDAIKYTALDYIDLAVEETIKRFKIDNLVSEIEKHGEYRFDLLFTKRNGTIEYKRHICTYLDDNKRTIVVVRHDVTDVYQAEKQRNDQLSVALELAEKSSNAKTEFLSSMSHDIRTPMNAIIGMTCIALDDIDNKEQVRESLETIKVSSTHLLSIINDILDMSRLESGHIPNSQQSFNHQNEIQKVSAFIKPLAEAKHQTYSEHLQVTHNLCNGDIVRLHRAVGNLLGNAVKFTPKGGNISFSVTELPHNNEKLAIYRFEIKDNGIGMTDYQVQHIFEPFYRGDVDGKYEGTGLGLSIVKAIVEANGGNISVKSKPNQGTIFIMDIPMAFADDNACIPINANKYDIKEENQLNGMKILLVEDHSVNQLVAKRLLERAGAIVTIASNGKDGFEQFKTSPKSFDAILMDIQMPIMNGYEATKAIRSLNDPLAKNIPIIAMTANAFITDKKSCIDAGMNAHISKPIEPPKLYHTLVDLIKNNREIEKSFN